MSHTRKRQFQPSNNQPSITSFFTPIDPSNPPPNFNPYDRKHVPAFAPPLPDQVQSQLMNMGMRIRKSVPEGYKTHKTMAPSSSAPSSNLPFSQNDLVPPSSDPTTLYSRPNELMPMCGLHKIGGFSSQPSTSSTPTLSCSQSTLSTTPSLPTTPHNATDTRKRTYSDEIEDELDAIFDDQDDDKNAHSTLTSDMPDMNDRTIAIAHRPKARMRARHDQIKFPLFETPVKDFDDEDVAFLQPMEESD